MSCKQFYPPVSMLLRHFILLPYLPHFIGVVVCVLAVTAASAQSFFDETAESTFVVGVDIKNTTSSDWHLEQTDWEHYQSLMQSEAGLYYRHLHPTWVLGIYAEDKNDQARFAEIAVRLERQRLSKLLDFNRAYRDAEKRITQGERPIDKVLFQYRLAQLERLSQLDNLSEVFAEKSQTASGPMSPLLENSRLAIYVSSTHCDHCSEAISQYLESDKGFDLYFVNRPSETDIQVWATKAGIPVDKVRDKEITLNYDYGQYAMLGFPDLPHVELQPYQLVRELKQ